LVDAALTRRGVWAGEEDRKGPPATAWAIDAVRTVFAGDDNVALFESLLGKPAPSGTSTISAAAPAEPAARQAPPEPPAEAPANVSKPEARPDHPRLTLGGLIQWLAQPWLVAAAGAWLSYRLWRRSYLKRSTRS
jgi:hypothetical protein